MRIADPVGRSVAPFSAFPHGATSEDALAEHLPDIAHADEFPGYGVSPTAIQT